MLTKKIQKGGIMDNFEKILLIEENFIPLRSYLKALENIIVCSLENSEPIPFTPVFDIFEQINLHTSKIDKDLYL